MKKVYFVLLVALLVSGCNTVPYEETQATWKSHEDVGNWLDKKFQFDKGRQQAVTQKLNEYGPFALRARTPEKLYKKPHGYCVDSAHFARENLNKINPGYNARWVFIENDIGRPNHWVTAFDYKGKLYVMDYGAGPHWSKMKGTHGPFDSLEDYREELIAMKLPGLKVGRVYYRDMPGIID